MGPQYCSGSNSTFQDEEIKNSDTQDHLLFNIHNLQISSSPGNRNRAYMVPRSYHQSSDEGDFSHLPEGEGSPNHSESNTAEDVPYMPGRIMPAHTASRGPLLAPDDLERQPMSLDVSD